MTKFLQKVFKTNHVLFFFFKKDTKIDLENNNHNVGHFKHIIIYMGILFEMIFHPMFLFSFAFTANFILQFLVLSLLVGIPLFTFHSSLGQLLGAGVMDMWRISPIFKVSPFYPRNGTV